MTTPNPAPERPPHADPPPTNPRTCWVVPTRRALTGSGQSGAALVGAAPPPPSPQRLDEQVSTQIRSLDTGRAGLQVRSAFPCGYCRLDSTSSIGDRCPRCGRCKAPLWWKTCVPSTATTTPSQRGRPFALSAQLAELRRHAAAIILVAIFVVCLGATAVLAVAGTAKADGPQYRQLVEISSGPSTHDSLQPSRPHSQEGR